LDILLTLQDLYFVYIITVCHYLQPILWLLRAADRSQVKRADWN